MERETQTNILFLDACRNNPLARNLARAMGTRSLEIGRGLAPVESGAGTLISFSTQPGNVALDGTGRNSPFTGSLVMHISNSNADLSRILIEVRRDVLEATHQKQVPWEHSALTGPFYFRQAPQLVGPSLEMEGRRLSEVAEAWTQAQGTKSVAALEAFIARYKDKDPFYAELARERIVELKRATMLHEPPPREPPEKAPEKSPACPNITGVWNSWASGFFGRGDTTFTKDGAARHRSGLSGRWWCENGRLRISFSGEEPKSFKVTSDGKRIIDLANGGTGYSR
jgi:hypothetical protein